MALASQVNTIVNQAAQMALGESAINVVDTSTLIALGDAVLSSETNVVNFGGALTALIGRTIISIREYRADMGRSVRHNFEYGLILRKIYVDIPDAQQNNSWNIGEEDYTPDFAPIFEPTIKEHLFNNLSTFSINVTIPDNLYKVAFRSAQEMATLISAIFIAMENKYQLSLENLLMLTRASFAARKLLATSGCHAINLLTTYNAVKGASLTEDNYLTNSDWLLWAATQIKLWRERMRTYSTLFNLEGYKRHTPNYDAILCMLADFDGALVAYSQSSTYHDELIRLTDYNVVPFWQGSGEDFDFNSTSAINVKLNATQTVSAKGILAILYDYQALGTMIDDDKTVAQRNNLDEYTTYARKVNRGYFNDMSENGIVFYAANSDYTAEQLLAGESTDATNTSSRNLVKKAAK